MGKTTAAPDLAQVIAERRKRIREDAPCEGCGATLASCMAERGKDPTAPPWFGCCARGAQIDIPCRHRKDPAALSALLDEIAAGHVRTVAEIDAEVAAREAERPKREPGKPYGAAERFRQGEWWRTKEGEWVCIAEMAESHRRNTARFLLRRAARYAHAMAFAELSSMEGAPEEVVDSWLRDDSERLADPEKWMRGTALYRALMDGLDDVPAGQEG